MRIFFYGIGRYYQERREMLRKLRQKDTFLGFLDRRAEDVPEFDGEPVYLPEVVKAKAFDAVIITAGLFREMKEVLLSYGVPENKILSYGSFLVQKMGEERYECGTFGDCQGPRLLFATPDLGYHGGAMAVVHAAIAMCQMGYRVTIAAAQADERLIQEIRNNPVKVLVFPSLQYASAEQLLWIRGYDVIVANTFSMVRFAVKASSLRPTLWWLHEVPEEYPLLSNEFSEAKNEKNFVHIRVAAVSQRAKRNFEAFYPDRVDVTIPYCLPDQGTCLLERKHEKTVFALIGGFEKRKAQDVFLEAVRLLPKKFRERAEFWLIGNHSVKDDFASRVCSLAERISGVKICGVMTREALRRAFIKIDVVVCASREECLPTTMVEGMMFHKVCIKTETAGMEEYFRDGENGFVVPTNDALALSNCMQSILEQPESFDAMKQKARETYQAYFTMSRFATRMREELQKTKETWQKNSNGSKTRK